MATAFPLGESLNELIGSALLESNARNAVIHAGHYALTANGPDAVRDDLAFESAAMPFASFARLTWRMACEYAAQAKGSGADVRLLVLVNDWQFVHERGGDRRESESKAASLRGAYYRDTPRLPAFHQSVLSDFSLDDQVVLRSRDDRWLFSESELRRDLATEVRKIFARGEGERHSLYRDFNADGQTIVTVRSEDQQDFTLLYCGSTNCAGEVVELLHILRQRGVDLFINLLPRQCFAPVETGTRLANQIYGLGGMKVVNVSIPFVEDLARGENVLVETSRF